MATPNETDPGVPRTTQAPGRAHRGAVRHSRSDTVPRRHQLAKRPLTMPLTHARYRYRLACLDRHSYQPGWTTAARNCPQTASTIRIGTPGRSAGRRLHAGQVDAQVEGTGSHRHDPAFRTGRGRLAAWAESTGRRRAAKPKSCGLRFAFYGRVSAEDYQDPLTSQARQLGQAGALVAGHGQIVLLRFREEPDAGVGAPPAGRRSRRSASRPGPRLGCGGDRGVRAGVLREPVRVDGAPVRALRDPAVDSRGRRPGRLRCRGSRANDDGARLAVQARDHPHQDPGPHRDGRADARAGQVPRRTAAVWVPARRRWSSPEQGPRGVGASGTPA